MRQQAGSDVVTATAPTFPEENYSPQAQNQRELERYVGQRWGEPGYSTQGPPSMGLGAQFTYPQNQYSGPDGAGVPQVAVSRYSAAQAVINAGLSGERATTLSNYPGLLRTLVNVGLASATGQFPEGTPRSAQQQILAGRTPFTMTPNVDDANLQFQASVDPSLPNITEADVARLLNVAEMESAARKYLLNNDPIRQAAILGSMSDIQRAAFYDAVQGVVEQMNQEARDGGAVAGALNWVFTTAGYGMDALWWLNRQMQHAQRGNLYAAMNGGVDGPLGWATTADSTGLVRFGVNAAAFWDNTDIGQYDQQQVTALKSQYGDVPINVLMDFATAQAKQQEQYTWDRTNVSWSFVNGTLFPRYETKDELTPLEQVMSKYQDDPEALNVIRQLVYAPAQNDDLVRAARGVDAASLWNNGQQIMNMTPLDKQGMAHEVGANAANVMGALANDPSLFGANLIRMGRVARYSIFRLAPEVMSGKARAAAAATEGAAGAEVAVRNVSLAERATGAVASYVDKVRAARAESRISRALSVPQVARAWNGAIDFMDRYRKLKDAEKAGTARIGSADNLRAAWEAGNQDLSPILDDMLRWNDGKGIRSLTDVRIMLEDANDLELVLQANPAMRVRGAPTMWEKLYTAASNNARREPLMPHKSTFGLLRNRTRQYLAVSGMSSRYGAKMATELFGTTDPAVIAQTLNDASRAIGEKYGRVAREEPSVIAGVTRPVGWLGKRRPAKDAAAGIEAVAEKNPGNYKYAQNSFAARWSRVTRLMAKKHNGGLIYMGDGRDADKIYMLARAFFPKYVAHIIEESFRAGTIGDRVAIHNGLLRSGAETMGVRLRYGDEVATSLINDLAAGGTAAFERYSPTIVKKVNKDGTVTYKVFGQDELTDGAFPLALRGPGEEFVNPAEIASNGTRVPARVGKEASQGNAIAVRGTDVSNEGIIPPTIPPGGDLPPGVPPDAIPDPESGEFITNPADFNGRQHPLHLWQTADYVRTPDFHQLELIEQRAGFWSAMLGWAETNPAKNVTDAWSLATLIGPRFVGRSALEDYAMWAMTDGSWTDLYKGRRAGTRIRAFRDAGQRSSKGEKWYAGQPTYWGSGSRLGIFNRNMKPRDAALRASEDTNNAYGRFVLDFLTSDERDAMQSARVAMSDALQIGDTVAARKAQSDTRQLLMKAFLRSHGMSLTEVSPLEAAVLSRMASGGVLQHMMDDILEQAASYNSVRVPTSADRAAESLAGQSGVSMGRLRYEKQYVDIGLDGSDPSAIATWYRSLVAAIDHDGPMGTVGIASLPKYANPRTRQQVIEDLANVIRKDTRWGYQERFAGLSEAGVTLEDFVDRYMTDLSNLFAKRDGTLNYDLWRKVAVREEAGVKPGLAPHPPTGGIPSWWRTIDVYDVLRVSRNASQDTIKRAYHRRLREVHPDVNSHPLAAEQTRSVMDAWEVLRDPTVRAEYDNATATLSATGAESYTKVRVTSDFLRPSDLRGYKPADRPQFIVGIRKSEIPAITDMSGMDKVWQVLGAQYNRISKEPIFLANVMAESRRLQPYYETLVPLLGEQAAESRVASMAVDRATHLTLSYTDNPANRTMFAWKARNVARYYRATEDFLRRMMRVTKNYPEGIWKVALTYDVMEETGFVWTDDRGDKYFLYPGTGLALNTIARVVNQIQGVTLPNMNLFELGGKVSMLTPSTDPRQAVPSLTGPVGVFLPMLFSNIVPEFDGLESLAMGEYSAGQSQWESLIPAGVVRVMKMLDQNTRLEMYNSSYKAALQIAVAAGLEPKGPNGEASTDEAEMAKFKQAIGNIAMTTLVGKLAFGFVANASPQIMGADVTNFAREMGGVTMNRIFRSLVDANGDSPTAFEDAKVQFYSTFGGDASPYWVGTNTTGEDFTGLLKTADVTALSNEAYAWSIGNRDVIKRFPSAATFLFPRDKDFDIKMWAWYRTNGYRKTRENDDYFQELAAAEGKFKYGRTEEYLLGLQAQGQPFVGPDGQSYEVTDDFVKSQLDAIRKQTPYLDVVLNKSSYTDYSSSMERLLNGDASQQGEVRRMLDYYYSPDFQGTVPDAVAGIAEAVATFDYWKQSRDSITGQKTEDRVKRASAEQALVYNLDLVGNRDENTRNFVDRVLMPLVKINLYGPGGNGISQVIPAPALTGR